MEANEPVIDTSADEVPEAPELPEFVTFDGILADADGTLGRLIQHGPGTQILTGDCTHTGGTLIEGGRLQIGDGGTMGSIVGSVENHGELAFRRSDDAIFSGAISGPGTVSHDGGTLRLTGHSLGSGTLLVQGGSVHVLGSWAGGFYLEGGTRISPGHGPLGSAPARSEVAPGGVVEGTGTIVGGLVNRGLVTVEGAWQVLTLRGGPLTNAPGGILRARRGATLNLSGATLLVNQGLIDRLSGTILLPPSFTNHGVIVDATSLRIKAAARVEHVVTVAIDGTSGHTYQLQRSRAEAPNRFEPVGDILRGTSGTELYLTDHDASEGSELYRVVADP